MARSRGVWPRLSCSIKIIFLDAMAPID
jgi:hypothetical protein